MNVTNYLALDVEALDLNEKAEVEVQYRGPMDNPRMVLYVHVNGITVCRVLCHSLSAMIPQGITVRRTRK